MKGLQPNVTDIDYYIRSRSIFLRQSWIELLETVSSRLDYSVCCEVREVMNDVVRHVQYSLSSDKNPGRSQSNVLINPMLPWQPPSGLWIYWQQCRVRFQFNYLSWDCIYQPVDWHIQSVGLKILVHPLTIYYHSVTKLTWLTPAVNSYYASRLMFCA